MTANEDRVGNPTLPGQRSRSAPPASRLKTLARLLLHRGALRNALHYRLHLRPSQAFGPSVSAGLGQRRSIALTFDDGPSAGTGRLLAYRAQQGIRATFFQCGLNVLRKPEMAKRVHAEGHEIGNHTFSHARLCPQLRPRLHWLTARSIDRELAETQNILKSITGKNPTLFRPPYGLRWFGLGKAMRRLGLLGVQWTVMGHDWEWPADRIAARILERASPGGILCLHDGRDLCEDVDLSPLMDALRLIVPALKAQGYRFETVSELLAPDR